MYLLSRHQYHLSMLTVFDQPVLATNCTRRVTSAVPLQSLTMMNDAFLIRQCEHIATRVAGTSDKGSGGVQGAEKAAFRLILQRSPNAAEMDRFTAYALQHGVANAVQLLINSNEFLYVD